MFKIKGKIWFLLFLFLMSTVFSANIVIYQQGMALVTGKIDSISKIFKVPVSEEIIPGSLNIYPAENVKKIEFHEGEKVNLKKYYESYIGSRIKFVLDDGTTKNFIVLSSDPLIFKDLETKEIYFDPSGYPIFPNELYMDLKNYFIVETFQPVDSLSFSYLTRGVNWNAEYFIALKSKDFLDISGYFNITNQLDLSFNNYSVYLLAGEVYQPQTNEEVRFMKTASYIPAPNAGYGQPIGQETGYRVYRVNIFDVPRKSNISIPLIQRELRYNKKFVSHNPRENYQPVSMVISIKDIPIDLPAGEIKIYDLIDGVEIFLGASKIRQVSKGDNLEVTYGKTSDILCKKVIKSSTKISKNSYRDTREIALKNLKDESVVVEVHDYLPNINWIDVKDPSVKFVLLSKSEVKFLVEVPAEKEFSFQYTIEYNY